MSELGHGNSAQHGFDSPDSHANERQTVLNMAWPYRDSAGHHARGVHDQPAERQVDVEVRVVFSRDGETWLPGRATAWANKCVMVAVNDVRLRPSLVWVDASDVRRR